MQTNYNHNQGAIESFSNKKLLLIVASCLLVFLVIAGFFGYKSISSPKPKTEITQTTPAVTPQNKNTETPYSSKNYKAIDVSTDNPNSSVSNTPGSSNTNVNSNDETRVPPNQELNN